MKRRTFAILFLAFLVLSSALFVGSALAKSKDKDKKPHPSHPEHPEHPIAPPLVVPPHQQPPVGPPANNTTIVNTTTIINNTEVTIVTEVTNVTITVTNNTIVIVQPKEIVVIREEVKEPPRFWIIFIVAGLALLSYGIAMAVAPKDSYWHSHKIVYYEEQITKDGTHLFSTKEVFD